MKREQWLVVALTFSLCLAVAGLTSAGEPPSKKMPSAMERRGGGSPTQAIGVVETRCPQGWKLAGKVGRDGSFECQPMEPAPMTCPEGTTYFSTVSAGQCRIGCRPVIK